MGSADLSPFGLTLQLLRQQQELSLNALGRLAGVDPAYLWRLERGEKQDPSLSVVRRIAIGLGMSPQAFLSRLFQVEAAIEAGKPLSFDASAAIAPEADTDTLIFAEVLSEREQKAALRQQLADSWPRMLPVAATQGRGHRTVPILGRIAAGLPLRVEDAEAVGTLTIQSAGLPADPDLFALEVDGDSLLGDNIRAGDLVLCSPRLVPDLTSGQVGVCRLYGADLTLKHVYRTPAGVLLRASNPAYPDLELPDQDIDILAVVLRALPPPEETPQEEDGVD